MRSFIAFLTTISFLLTFPIHAQALKKESLDSLLVQLEQHDKFMGSIALSEKGSPIYQQVCGSLSQEDKKRADISTKYRIGSISKTFTATLIMMAVQEGKLSLDQPLASFYPQIPAADQISLEHLLRHRSGIFNFTDGIAYTSWHTMEKSREELLEIIQSGGSVFEPGSKAQYSNSNYVLLTFILEDVYQKKYSELIREKITLPLKLSNTYVGAAIDPAQGEARSYRYSDGWQLEAETNMSIPLGAGALVATPTDLNLFITALFQGKLVNKNSLDQMTKIIDGYGMGLIQFPYGSKIGYGHGGGIDGFSSFLGYIPEDDVALALCSNGTNYTNNDILIAMLDVYYGKDYQVPSFDVMAISPEKLEQYSGEYSSSRLPLEIKVWTSEEGLMAQATGQPAFPLEAGAEHTFSFQQAGLIMKFDPKNSTMTLKQGGGSFLFKKK